MSSRVSGLCAVDSAVPGYLWNSGIFRAAGLVDNGAGDLTHDATGAGLSPGLGFDALGSIVLAGARHAGAPPANSFLHSFGVVHVDDEHKRVTSLLEGAGGAVSALADQQYDLAALELGYTERTGFAILGWGSIAYGAGAPAYVSRGGLLPGALADTGPGDIGWTWGGVGSALAGGFDGLAAVVVCTPRGILAPSGLQSISTRHVSDATKQISLFQEAALGGASVPTDFNFDFVIFGRVPQHQVRGLSKLHGICSIVSGVGPAFRLRDTPFATIARTGAGDYNLTLGAGYGVDATRCAIVASPRGAAVASALKAIAINHTSDTVKQITLLQEDAAGAASIAADFDFDLAIVTPPGR